MRRTLARARVAGLRGGRALAARFHRGAIRRGVIRRRLSRAARLGGRLALALVLLGSLATLALYATTDVDRARFARPEDAVTLTDRHGTPLRHHRPDGRDRRWVSIDEVSPHLIDAIVAVEDRRFFEHGGVDVRASVRAALSFAWPGRRLSGASTITQQVVKLTYGRPDGLLDKPREVIRAVMLEDMFDKHWLLEQYLNRVPYGDRVVGVARASELYFGKPVSELTVSEAALLAGIPQAPSALDPRRHPAAAMRRQRFVLSRMLVTGRLDEASHRRCLAEPPVIQARPMRPWRAPRWSDRALEAWRAGALERRGGRVRTSLDLVLQEEAERTMRAAVEAHRARGVSNGAAVVLHNRTGEVLAYVGAAHTGSDAAGGWLDLARARRQPGSTLKPFVYELLFEQGGTAATLLDDISRPMLGAEGAMFTARDYDGHERGPVRARVALSASLNLAALDAARRVGAAPIVQRLRDLGISDLDDASRYGAAIVLGGADVSPLELTDAYATLARGGLRVPVRFGAAGSGPPPPAMRIMEEGAARVTRDILSDSRARREAFGDDLSLLMADPPFALKTGTSSGWRDAWTAVFTDELTVVVWLGDPAGRPLGGLSGFSGAARPAVSILRAGHDRLAALGLEPDGVDVAGATSLPLATRRICAATGHLAGPSCARTFDERFVTGTEPAARCEAHRGDGAVLLPSRYAAWLRAESPVGFALTTSSELEGVPAIAHPRDGARLLVAPDRGAGEIPLRAHVNGVDAPVTWEVDGEPIEGARWRPSVGSHVLVARLDEHSSEPVTVDVVLAR